jgi:hypothetical protein
MRDRERERERPFGPENFTDNGDTYGMTNDAASLLIPEVRRR